MDVLKFRLSGRSAFFKQPDVNAVCSFTYGHIHKVALLGMFGAILGYRGYNTMDKTREIYPEFYDRLRGLSVSICPKAGSKGQIQKKIQSFNNSTGYASEEKGGILIVKQQWLYNPEWDIYVKLDCEEAIKLKDSIMGSKAVYIPYLGSNDHPATISDAEVLELSLIGENEATVDSLFPDKRVKVGKRSNVMREFVYREYLPMGLTEEINMYILENMVYTNQPVKSKEIYRAGDKNIIFY